MSAVDRTDRRACECECTATFLPNPTGILKRFASRACQKRASMRRMRKSTLARSYTGGRKRGNGAAGYIVPRTVATLASAWDVIPTSVLARLAKDSDLALYAMCSRLRQTMHMTREE